MLIKDLITQLQQLIDDNEPHKDIMGEAEIVIDVFRQVGDSTCFHYQGFTPNIRITQSADGVYPILTAFSE